jgi:hypothetical protein
MEYSLASKLSKRPFVPSTFVQLPKYPTNFFSTPGVGFTAKLYSFYVPIHGNTNSYLEQKVTDTSSKSMNPEEQIGAGSSNTRNDLKLQFAEDKNINQDSSLLFDSLPIELKEENEKKRKLVGDKIYNAMLHPKFKVSKTVFNGKLVKPTSKKVQNQTKKSLETTKRNQKGGKSHNFKVI